MVPLQRDAQARRPRRRRHPAAGVAPATAAAAAALLLGAVRAAAEGQCGRAVALPPDLGEQEIEGTCPEDTSFLRGIQRSVFGRAREVRTLRDAGQGDDSRSAAAESESQAPGEARQPRGDEDEDLQLPDCRHEIGVQILWHSLYRRHLNGTQIVGGVYRSLLFRATPKAIAALETQGLLRSVTLHVPGLHSIGGHRFDAELHFRHEGEGSGPDFTIVVPIEARWDWDAPHHHVLTWLARPQHYADNSMCAFTLRGLMTRIRNGFRCPGYKIHADNLLQGGKRALRYEAGSGCQNTFVVTEGLTVAGEQLALVKDRVEHRGDGEEPWRPDEVVLAQALAPLDVFTVFTAAELQFRRGCFFSAVFLGLFVMVGLFLAVRKCADIVELDIMDYLADPCVKVNTLIDHWLSYLAALFFPWAAYASRATNRLTGMPVEFLYAWYICLMAHLLHELVMFVQVGSAVRRISYLTTARMVVMSFWGVLHYELHIQFGIIAMMSGSWIGSASITTFVVCNLVGQLIFTTVRAPKIAMFKVRSFEVMNHLVEKRLHELEKVALVRDQEDLSPNKRFQQAEEEEADSGTGGCFNFMSTIGDLFQGILQVIFVSKYDTSPLITGSMLLTLFYLFAGPIYRLVYRLMHKEDPVDPGW